MSLSNKVIYSSRAEECVVDIHPSVVAEPFEVTFKARNCRLEIGEGCNFKRLKLDFLSDNTIVRIGRGVRANSTVMANVSGVGSMIEIGDDCLFSNIKLRTSDSHDIFDLATGSLLNPAGDIRIGSGVWIAEDVLLLKGSDVGDGSVIGAKALVNSMIPPNSLAVGIPAKAIRNGIGWRSTLSIPDRPARIAS